VYLPYVDKTVYSTLHKMDSVHFGEHTVLKLVSNATVDLNATDILSYSNKELGETKRVLDVWDRNGSTIGHTP